MKNRFKEDKILTILTIIDLKIEDLEKRMDLESNTDRINELYMRKLELMWLLDDIREVLKDDSEQFQN